MAKRKVTIGRWDSGIIEGPNPRDIAMEASTEMQGLDPSKIGSLKPVGKFKTAAGPTFPEVHVNLLGGTPPIDSNNNGVADNPAIGSFTSGYGLFQFTSDYAGITDEKLVYSGTMFGNNAVNSDIATQIRTSDASNDIYGNIGDMDDINTTQVTSPGWKIDWIPSYENEENI